MRSDIKVVRSSFYPVRMDHLCSMFFCEMFFCDVFFCDMFFCDMFFYDMFLCDMSFCDMFNIARVLKASKRMHLCFRVIAVLHKRRLVLLVVKLHDFLVCSLTRPTTLSQYPTTNDVRIESPQKNSTKA